MCNRTVIAFDFGTKNIGIAIGQELTGYARALASMKSKVDSPNWEKIGKALQEWEPELVVVGLPLNMDGSEQTITNLARKFSFNLHARFGIPTILHDERLSTIEARSSLFHYGGYSALNKDSIDAASAVIILESWFRSQ